MVKDRSLDPERKPSIILKIYEFTLLQLIRGNEVVIEQSDGSKWYLHLDEFADMKTVKEEVERRIKNS